jgi:predicted permease
MLAEESLDAGATPSEAKDSARRKLGNTTSICEAVYESSRIASLDAWAGYLRAASRSVLRNKPAYASVAAILALGIGMSVAMFSLVDAVLIRPLPFPQQQSIQVIWKSDPLAGNQVGELAYPELRDLQESISGFDSVAVMPTSLYGYSRVLQQGGAEPVQIESAPVSHDFFRVLGVSPALGRDFTASDEHVGAAPVVILSDRVWRDRLGADPAIVGRPVRLNGEAYTVIGVVASGVEFPRGAGLWFPLGVDPAVVTRRGATFLQAIARTKPNVSREKIAAEVNALFTRQAADHPEVYSRSQKGVVTPVVEYWTGSARIHLWIMLGASLLLLAGSIATAGNLLLSRTLRRRYEIATRLALGARRRQIVAQLGAEGVLIAAASAIAGLAVAQSALRILVRFAPPDIPRLPDAALDLGAFSFAAAITCIGAIACTVIPAWVATRIGADSALREGQVRSSSSRREGRLRHVFVVAHSALSVMLLVAASLLVLSYRAMISSDIGFAHRDAVSMNLQLHGPGLFSGQAFDATRRRMFYADLLEHLRQQPGVASAAAVLLRPLEGTIGWDVSYQFEFESANTDGRPLPKANYEVVTPDYFNTVGTPLLEGRDFSSHDSEAGEPVAIISQAPADRIRQAGRVPVGSQIRVGLTSDRWTKIIGVTANARYRGVTQSGADIFVPSLQAAQPTNYLVIRGTRSAGDLATLVRRTLAAVAPDQTVAGVATIGEMIDANSARHRFDMLLLLWFSVCAAILGAGGVYSVVTQLIAGRTHEITIKRVLGAQRFRLMREMLTGTIGFALLGEIVGVLTVSIAAKPAAGLLYRTSANDPAVLSAVVLFLFVISMAAAALPAWKASRGR